MGGATMVVLIATIMYSGFPVSSMVHVEHDYPSVETCQSAYAEVYKQAHELENNANVTGKCLKVK